MASILPPLPKFFFSVLEPLALLVSPVAFTLNQRKFIAAQLPSTSQNIELYRETSTERILALQLVNMYGVIGMIEAVVLYTTSEPKVVHRFLLGCAIGDLGHLAAVISVMGIEDATNVRAWNDLAWGGIGFTILILAIRVLYLMGFLGTDRLPNGRGKTH